MEAQRALLDSLMGFNRDGDRPDDDPQLDFRHPRVCKPYLCGLCPRELFQNTRLDAGACGLIHSPSIRSAYEEEAKRDFGYERELTNELSRLLSDVERKITKAKRRLDEDNGDTCPDTAQSQSQSRSDAKDVDVNQKLRVCDVCGAFLSIFDSERRLADHFGGKVHVGYVQIRRKLKELADEKQQQEKEKEKEKEKKVERTRRSVSRSRRVDERPRSRRDDGDRERRRGRQRSRSRERRRSSRDRHRRRSESSSRSRSRSRDRKRQRSRRR